MAIRIGEDGTIISSEGEIQQGQNPLIGEDGSIRLSSQPASSSTPSGGSRRPPSSPLQNAGSNQASGTRGSSSSSQATRPASRNSRSISTIEYELQVKKAELSKCIRPVPIVVCIVFLLIAFLMSSYIPAIVSLIALVLIVMDIVKRSSVSEEIHTLESELKNAQTGGAA